LIPNPFTPAIAANLTTALVGIHTLLDPIVVTLSTAQTEGLAPVSTVRDSEIEDIFSGVQSVYSQTLPTGVTLADLTALNLEELNTSLALAACTAVSVILENHLKIVRNNQLAYARQSMDNAGLAGKSNPAIAAARKVISVKYYSKAAKKPATAYTVAAGGKITVNGVGAGKMFTNTGAATLSFLNLNGNAGDTITVGPASGAMVPKGWTNIVVTNLSATVDGSFTVFIK
jgi:hypothetical protein